MAEGAATRALRESLRVLGPAGRDQAAVQLAKRYAALLDAAAVPSTFRVAFERLAAVATDKADAAALAEIRDALGAHSVASDLGPKYLATLAQLGLTPAARGVLAAAPVPAPAAEPEPVAEPEGKADELRQRRARRAQLGAVDSG